MGREYNLYEENKIPAEGGPLRTDMTIAVLLAGGVGERVGLGIPKQLLKVAGKTILEHTLDKFNASRDIDEIIIMMNPASIKELDNLLEQDGTKLTKILPGGCTRNETTQLALKSIEGNPKVLFHDAVRPFVDTRIINDCVKALDVFEAVDTAIPSADTIIQVDDKNCIAAMPLRSQLRRGQTPQGFRADTLREAYRLAANDSSFSATDDCGVVFKYLPSVPIKVVHGSAENMKVTEPIDVHIADKIFQLQSADSSALDSNAASLADQVIVIFGGSHGIGHSIAEQASQAGANVFSFSRSSTNTDVNELDQVEQALQSVMSSAGKINHIVVTAGVLRIDNLISANIEDIRNTLSTNLLAPALIAKTSFKYLSQTEGSLSLFTSSSYTRGRAGYSMYSATKAGIVNLTQALAEEWADSGVRVNAINPQRTATPMRTAAFGVEPEGTLLSADEVANATLQILAADITGQTINIRK